MRKNSKRPRVFARLSRNRSRTYLDLQGIVHARTKNLVRGILSTKGSDTVSPTQMNAVREEAGHRDLATATRIILGKKGGFPFSNTGATYRSLLRRHHLSDISSESEIYFTAGHLNGWAEEVREILGALATMSKLPSAQATDALEALYILAERWGASNYLAKKIAFIVSREGKSHALIEPLSRLAKILDQQKYSVPFFTAMEDMDPEFDYFGCLSNRVQVVSKYVDRDFRNLLPLHNIAPVPVSLSDVAGFLRKAHSMSLVDEVVALLQIMAISDDWPTMKKSIQDSLHPSLLQEFEKFRQITFDAKSIYDDVDPSYADIMYYRRSNAFVEFSEPCKFRYFVDKIVSKRLLPEHMPGDIDLSSHPMPSVRDLTRAKTGFRQPTDYLNPQASGTFLRTIWFLLYLEKNKSANNINHSDLRNIFNGTSSLDILLTPAEIERLYATADEDSKPLITVLALALYKSRSNDDDVDFKFRLNLSKTIIEKFNGDIVSFISWLLPTSPEVANFLLSVLDRQTLQKMYWLVQSPREADEVRQSILRTVGKVKGRLEYFVEADAIEAQRQVSKLQMYFDDSRMYVDGYAMKRWLIENPNSYTQQYIRLIEHSADPASVVKVNITRSGTAIIQEASALAAFDYILVEVAKSAFTQFCINTNFGIESYLGRRIRHNTLTGMMRGGVETIIEKPYYHVLTFDDAFREAHARWVDDYRSIVEHLRKDDLQFKTQQKPKGVFSSELNVDEEPTKTNLAVLRGMAFSAKSSDLFNELLIRFCWQEIDPQLNATAKLVTVDFLNDALSQINYHFGGFTSELQRQFQSELHDEVHSRFTRLGSWFRQPDSGFVSASTKELGDLIFMEATDGSMPMQQHLKWDGSASGRALDGLSVHRMYDCLSVLIRNAHKYGDVHTPIEVSVNLRPSPQPNIARMEVSVTSKFADDENKDENVRRLRECFADDDLSASMMKEGYSGIKKLRFITFSCEGYPTVHYQITEELCAISFALTVELVESQNIAP